MMPAPASPEFGARLLERLRGDAGLGAASSESSESSGSSERSESSERSVSIAAVEAFSRNTMIYRLRSPLGAIVAKVPRELTAARLDDSRREYEHLNHLRRQLASAEVHLVEPIAHYADLGAMLTREVRGESLRAWIDRGIREPIIRPLVETLIDAAGRALLRFHAAFGVGDDSSVEAYVDYSPRNVIVTDERELILIDTPRGSIRAPRWNDLGTFCFDIQRAAFAPGAIARASGPWLDRIKARFVSAYFAAACSAPTSGDLARIRVAERVRAWNALSCYAPFWRYSTWAKELARLAWLGPITLAYSAFGAGASWRRVAARLDEREAEVVR